ncbi:putative Woronin body protein HexA [Aspergillus puulaauensis]|uniref:Woronin body major protein n=1 Tax=Aspergillus puulaauensis TaxID=1220207 RepID=A0A7R7XX93_9EURO|nr:uncharacterized protein APUU_70986A [Aspergillus puulaauensis]BCS29416.1 hypothetical protein APUU_70986A [Aspergillus puulaauensis]
MRRASLEEQENKKAGPQWGKAPDCNLKAPHSSPRSSLLFSLFPFFISILTFPSHIPSVKLIFTFLPQEFSTSAVEYRSIFGRDSRKDAQRTANLDFDARVPIPFSVFPSSYRSDAVPETTLAAERVEGEVNLDRTSHVEREDTRTSAPLPDPRAYGKEEVDLHFERRSDRRRGDDFTVVDERVQDTRYPQVDLARDRYREPPAHRFQDSYKDKEQTYDKTFENQLDITEREYRRRTDPTYDAQASSFDRRSQGPIASYEAPRQHTSDVYSRPSASYNVSYEAPRQQTSDVYSRPAPSNVSYDRGFESRPLDVPRGNSYDNRQVSVESVKPPAPSSNKLKVLKTTTVVDHPKARKMGYYDDDGNYHSFRRGVERAVDRITHPFHHHHDHGHHDHHDHREEVVVADERGPVRVRENVRIVEPRGGASTAETVPIPCHFIRAGDILILQGRPSQVIRISTSPQTGQHRYLGVDLFTRELHEESSFISNPSPSVVVQTMLGPVYKTYRILDIRDSSLVALTESGDVKTGLPVVPQDNLHGRIRDAFHEGRGSVRVLVINDGGRELVVDFKVIHASRL